MKKDGWLRACLSAFVLCGAAMPAAADCAALARHPSWAECAAEFSVAATRASGEALDGPLQLQFDEDAAALAQVDFTTLAVKPSSSRQISTEPPSTVAAIPEPHTNLLMLAGLAATIGFMAMRRRRP